MTAIYKGYKGKIIDTVKGSFSTLYLVKFENGFTIWLADSQVTIEN